MTTGKLRGMHPMMARCVDKLSDYLDSIIASKSQGALNIKEVMVGFAVDVIASTSFATDVNITDRSSSNPFLFNAIRLFDFKVWRFALLFLLPDVVNRAIGNSIGLSDKRFNFFRDLARAIIKQRKEAKLANGGKNKQRSDIVQLMIDAYVYEDSLRDTSYAKLTASAENDDHHEAEPQKSTNNSTSSKKRLTENEIIAQCILVFAAGFETTATTTSNILYFLSLNPEIQDRLVEELNSSLKGVEEDSAEYYEVVMNRSPYLEAVIKETLRISPPVGRLQRRVGVDGYQLGGITLDKNIEVDISVLAVHRDPRYYPEPDRFNPDRFLPENKHLLTPYTFLVFGDGPRNCMGMRFAYQEIRLCLAKIVRRFAFERTPETVVPLNYDKIGFLTCKNIPLK
ncbi:PREDICTED: cytochrome P450 3A12-like, partial [Rhagoletis zephyria]|uniref:cytochrome P450 3A12-like n=1 Tax=Rhagoletis zephyria TaxID=28612 RepID=UPI000811A1D1